MSQPIFKIIKGVVDLQNPSDFNFSFVLSFSIFEGQREDCFFPIFYHEERAQLEQSPGFFLSPLI